MSKMGHRMRGLVCQTMKLGLGSLAGPVKGLQQGSGAIHLPFRKNCPWQHGKCVRRKGKTKGRKPLRK